LHLPSVGIRTQLCERRCSRKSRNRFNSSSKSKNLFSSSNCKLKNRYRNSGCKPVAAVLTQNFGIPPENLTTQGYGEQFLKIPTQAPERRNRGVSVRRITSLLSGQN
jgi:hypothetical protein